MTAELSLAPAPLPLIPDLRWLLPGTFALYHLPQTLSRKSVSPYACLDDDNTLDHFNLSRSWRPLLSRSKRELEW